MANARKRESRERRTKSARTRAETHTTFEVTTYKAPQGVGAFWPKKGGVYSIEVIPYDVKSGKDEDGGNPYADKGDLHYERTFFAHKGVGANKETYVCPRKTAKKRCPICEFRTAESRKDDGDEQLIKDLAPKERQLFLILDHAEMEKGLLVWDISYHLFGKMLDARIKNADEEDGWDYFHDPEDGKTIKLGLEEKPFAGKSYLDAETIDFRERKNVIDPEIFDNAPDLDSILSILPYDKLKSIFLQTPEDDSSGDNSDQDQEREKEYEGESKAAKKKASPKSKPVKTAEDFGIGKGDEVSHPDHDGVLTVLKISSDGTSLTLLDEKDELIRAISPNEVKPISVEASAPEAEADENEWEDSDKSEGDKEEPQPAAVESGEGKKEDWDEDWEM